MTARLTPEEQAHWQVCLKAASQVLSGRLINEEFKDVTADVIIDIARKFYAADPQ